MKVFAFVVTYNRLELLKHTIQCLKSQTFIPEKIFIVNNGSTDGTAIWLKEQEGIFVINQENVGGAGGFHSGVKYAYEQGAEWIWMMDDDVFPRNDALECLLEYHHISECIMPSRYYSDGVKIDWGYFYDISKRTITNGSRPKECDIKKEFYPINTGCFEGMLISRKVVSSIGYPDPRFFISGDDTIYGLKASRYTNLIIVEKAILDKAQKSFERKVSPMYFYYMYRNFHLFEEYYQSLYGKAYNCKIKMINLVSIFYRYRDAKQVNKMLSYRALRFMILGLIDSHRKKVGRTHPMN